MHSRKKRLIPPSAEEVAAEKLRLEKIQKLHKMVFDEIATGNLTDEGFALSEKAICISPDIYTFLNFRRKLLLGKLMEASEELKLKIFSQELDVLSRIIKESPKSYTLWYHRQWVLKQCKNISQIMQKELALCDYMLKKDNRNFHVWNYRNWVVELEGEQSVNEEMEFTKGMIFRDFSNFSAWHYRTKVVKKKFSDEIPLEFIKSELAMLKNAYFTCPNDQSVWNYHRWLLQSLETIKIASVHPRSYEEHPQSIVFGFTHSVCNVGANSIAVSHGWESLEGTWEPLHTKPYSYIWKFTANRNPEDTIEIRLSPVNSDLTDFNGKKKLTEIIYKYKKTAENFQFSAEGSEDAEVFLEELKNINELLDIEEDDIVQVLLRKAQISEQLAYALPNSSYIDTAIQCYQQLLQKDPKHKIIYEELLNSFLSIKSNRKIGNFTKHGKIAARVLGLE